VIFGFNSLAFQLTGKHLNHFLLFCTLSFDEVNNVRREQPTPHWSTVVPQFQRHCIQEPGGFYNIIHASLHKKKKGKLEETWHLGEGIET
jgi:hypothetical protein